MILRNYSYMYEALKIGIQVINNERNDYHTIDIYLSGSRMSAKTLQTQRACLEAMFLPFGVNINWWRYEPKGSQESFNEFINIMENIYDISPSRDNTNLSKKNVKLNNNIITFRGLMSNRKISKPKLGTSRNGIKKQIEINIIDEISEFETGKQVELLKQATGGAKFNINIHISNPWVSSHFHIAKIGRHIDYSIKKLKTIGEQFAIEYIKKKKKIEIFHVSNHRINTYLNEAQHQILFDSWKYGENFGKVVDLGLPGVSDGLVYMPIMNKIEEPMLYLKIEEIGAGLDWGTSTGKNASSTALIMGRITREYRHIMIDKEYYHSNETMRYKDDNELVRDIIDCVLKYIGENIAIVRRCGFFFIDYDYAAFALGALLENEIERRKGIDNYEFNQNILNLIEIRKCVKFRVPNRIDATKSLISQGRFFLNKKQCPTLFKEMEQCQWDETKLVENRPTRENRNDHCLDAMEYWYARSFRSLMGTHYFNLKKINRL